MNDIHNIRPFLESVAKAYLSRFGKDGFPNAYECCFVFPNKRAGTFFLKYIKENAREWMLAPEVTTITDLVTRLSGRIVNNRIDLIFLLYNCYCELLDPQLPPEEREKLVSFDSFRKWGETVMQDFNEIDMQIADSGRKAEEIFQNVADFRNISSSFLNEEQRKVIEEYFGYHFSDSYDSQFWTSLNYKSPETSNGENKNFLREKFIELWKILSPLYNLYHQKMEKEHIISSGGAYRIAVERLSEAMDVEDGETLRELLPFKKMVMVGFNALSVAERQLFNILKKIRSVDIYEAPEGSDKYFVDFLWDATGPVLRDFENSAGRFVRINRSHYPSPEWTKEFINLSDTDSFPATLEAVGAPSGVMQVKIATEIIKNLHSQIEERKKETDSKENPFDEARVALVVPDENLLLPLLYSIPKEIPNVNLTMGYPLRLTAVTSFLQLIRKMQLARRDSKDYNGYNFEQVSDLLSHPLAHSIFPTEAISRFLRRMQILHISVVKFGKDLAELERSNHHPKKDTGARDLKRALNTIFKPLDKNASSEEVIRYYDDILALLEDSINYKSGTLLKGNLELHHIIAWRDALRRFEDSIRRHQVKLGIGATMAEIFRLLQAEVVAFEGEPLKGLQIMGMLETRAIDFDYLIVVGLNDRTIPGRMRQRSFIPNIIRMGYGMPPNTYQEDLFGYYFYRMLSRARHATFIYDSRITGFTGGISRYLQQLRYIYAKDRLKQIDYKFKLSPTDYSEVEISKKSELASRRLDEYIKDERTEGYRSLSASLLKSLTACGVKFYFKGILDMTDNPAPTPSINRITEGNIVHKVMQDLYVRDKALQKKWLGESGGTEPTAPIEISEEYLKNLLTDEGRAEILEMVKKEIMDQYYHRGPDAEWITDSDIQAVIILNQICDILKYDLSFAPFRIFGVEINEKVDYTLPDGRKVTIKYIIDRIDDINDLNKEDSEVIDKEVRKNLRIVDYKTGGSGIEASSLESLFDSDYRKDNLLQLLLYSLLINLHREQLGQAPINFRPRIYPVGRLNLRKTHFKQFKTGERKGEWYRDKNDKDRVPIIGDFFIEDIQSMPDGETPVIDSFRHLLDKCLMELFNKDISWKAIPKPDECHGCVFFNACSSGAIR